MADEKIVHRWVPVDIIFAESVAPNDDSLSESHPVNVKAPLVTLEPHMSAARTMTMPERIGRLFRRTTPMVTDLTRDALLIEEGLLDACLEKHKQREWLKVRMPESIASRWDSRSSDRLDATCKRQNRKQIYTPIMHSSYRNYNYSRRGSARLDMIRQFLGPTPHGMTLLDIGCNCGYYVFHFCRQGMNVTGIDIDEEHLEIAKAQIPMYQLDADVRNIALQDFQPAEPFDIVLALSVFWHILGWGKMPAAMSESEFTGKLDEIVGSYLLWESGPQPAREIELICSGTRLTKFQQLGTTSATGIDDRVFGVFTQG